MHDMAAKCGRRATGRPVIASAGSRKRISSKRRSRPRPRCALYLAGWSSGGRKPLGFPSSSSPRAGFPQRPLAIRALGEAALFQRLQRKGYGSSADVSACRPDMLGDLGGRKGALLAKNVSDRRADGLARLRLVACLRLAIWVWLWLWPRRRSCLPRGKLFERPDLALGDAKIGDLRLQLNDLRADAFECCVH